jgi:hypothetical protein
MVLSARAGEPPVTRDIEAFKSATRWGIGAFSQTVHKGSGYLKDAQKGKVWSAVATASMLQDDVRLTAAHRIVRALRNVYKAPDRPAAVQRSK